MVTPLPFCGRPRQLVEAGRVAWWPVGSGRGPAMSRNSVAVYDAALAREQAQAEVRRVHVPPPPERSLTALPQILYAPTCNMTVLNKCEAPIAYVSR